MGNFDAITYEKGAAVIKQLVAAIGDEPFRAGMRLYFDRHAWGNATLADLLAALGDAAGRPLEDWARLWLQSASLNTIGARWHADGGRVAAMELRQSAPSGHPVLRPHATVVGLVWQPPEGGPLAVDAIPARIEGEVQDLPEAIGRPAPLFVYPNHGDHDYALVHLDADSAGFALERLPDLPDALLRQQVWSTLWEMVRGRHAGLDRIPRRGTPVRAQRAGPGHRPGDPRPHRGGAAAVRAGGSRGAGGEQVHRDGLDRHPGHARTAFG